MKQGEIREAGFLSSHLPRKQARGNAYNLGDGVGEERRDQELAVYAC